MCLQVQAAVNAVDSLMGQLATNPARICAKRSQGLSHDAASWGGAAVASPVSASKIPAAAAPQEARQLAQNCAQGQCAADGTRAEDGVAEPPKAASAKAKPRSGMDRQLATLADAA